MVSGKVEQGTINSGDDCEIVGFSAAPIKTTCIGVEMFNKVFYFYFIFVAIIVFFGEGSFPNPAPSPSPLPLLKKTKNKK